MPFPPPLCPARDYYHAQQKNLFASSLVNSCPRPALHWQRPRGGIPARPGAMPLHAIRSAAKVPKSCYGRCRTIGWQQHLAPHSLEEVRLHLKVVGRQLPHRRLRLAGRLRRAGRAQHGGPRLQTTPPPPTRLPCPCPAPHAHPPLPLFGARLSPPTAQSLPPRPPALCTPYSPARRSPSRALRPPRCQLPPGLPPAPHPGVSHGVQGAPRTLGCRRAPCGWRWSRACPKQGRPERLG